MLIFVYFAGKLLLLTMIFKFAIIIAAALRRQREARDTLEKLKKERKERKDGAPGSGRDSAPGSGAQQDGNPLT